MMQETCFGVSEVIHHYGHYFWAHQAIKQECELDCLALKSQVS